MPHHAFDHSRRKNLVCGILSSLFVNLGLSQAAKCLSVHASSESSLKVTGDMGLVDISSLQHDSYRCGVASYVSYGGILGCGVQTQIS